ncbi:ATP-binding protein [Thalassotalea sp. PLHSN55]|uniref:sensor histidine kinase n=1 Tax=Thalassotalea sp. PLHSN55 TaxID=3435888 RepID=UPI003F8285C3
MDQAISFNNKLSRHVLVYILVCSLFLSVCSTIFQLYSDFNDDVATLKQRFVNIENSYLQSLSTSLWDFNEPLVNQQIQGIVNLPDINYAEITTGFGKSYTFGQEEPTTQESAQYSIFYGDNEIGVLTVHANYADIYKKLKQRAWVIIISEFVRTFIVALCIMFIVHWLVTRHIYTITKYSQNLASDNLDKPLILPNRSIANEDELDMLAAAINDMRMTLKSDIVKLEEAENALINLNGELEVKVYDRTEKLAVSNRQLQQSLDDLTLAKDSLVQSEKMASLGQLVAGVAHEVNTPLGICVTSITALKEKLTDLTDAIENENLTKSQLTSTLSLFDEYQQIIERSLNKAVELIRGFKSVAVEQHTDPELNINLAQHVNDVVNTVKTLFKRKKYTINLSVDKELSLITYPSAWNQILTNFLMNSHIHGFEGRDEGEINVCFTEEDNELVLNYSDNGKGIDNHLKKKVFDPFVTTKRGQGGSGLGLNIVFNLVSSKLHGSIQHIDDVQGCHFRVRVPLVKKDRGKPKTIEMVG